jgi:hypothetical protein
MAIVTTFCEFFGCGGGGGTPGNGNVANLLSVDYEDDWLYLDGVESVDFAFGPQRYTTQTVSGFDVKAKRSSPSHNEVVVAAATVGYESTDQVFVVWAETLIDTLNAVIEPMPGDKIIAFDYEWIIKSVKRNVDFSQWRMLCRKTTKEE